MDNLLSPSMIRYVYFQKQAVVGDAFSLLSIGDSSTGYNVDLEFALIGNGVRKYFDEGNACVIPLTLEQLAGVGQISALSQTGDINRMLDLHFRKELLVRNPEEVVNGLTLYVHALCDKGQSPIDEESEDFYGKSFCRAFLAQCQLLIDAGQDPLRFVLSFVRSHYALRSTLAAAAVAQMLVEISSYASEVWDTELGQTVSLHLAMLLSDAIMASLDEEVGAAEGMLAACWLTAFLADPATADARLCSQDACGKERSVGPVGRIRTLYSRGGDRCQVLGKRRPVATQRVCVDVAAQLRRCAQDAAPWQRAILAAAWEPLEQEASGGGATGRDWSGLLRAGLERVMSDADRGDVACQMLLGPGAAALVDRMCPHDTYAAAQALLACAPAEECGAVSGLVVKAAAAAGVAAHVAARGAIKALQHRKYECACMQPRPRPANAWQIKPVTPAGVGSGCGGCCAVGRAMQRLLVHVVPGPPLPRRSPDVLGPLAAVPQAAPPCIKAACGAAAGSKAGQAPPPPRSARRLCPGSPPAPPPGPTTPAPPGAAPGPPPPHHHHHHHHQPAIPPLTQRAPGRRPAARMPGRACDGTCAGGGETCSKGRWVARG